MESKEYLNGVNRLTTGQQAALRREVGKCLHEADAQALQAFYTALPDGAKATERSFAVMCMICLWHAEDRVNPRPFAECLRLLDGGDSIVSRLRSALDTSWNEGEGYLLTKLSRLARQIRSKSDKRLYPDFEQLLKDLNGWNHSSRYVQRRWMEQFLRTTDTINPDTQTNFEEEA